MAAYRRHVIPTRGKYLRALTYKVFKNHADVAASARRGNRTREKPFGLDRK